MGKIRPANSSAIVLGVLEQIRLLRWPEEGRRTPLQLVAMSIMSTTLVLEERLRMVITPIMVGGRFACCNAFHKHTHKSKLVTIQYFNRWSCLRWSFRLIGVICVVSLFVCKV